MNRLCELVLEIFFYSTAMNRSILFSLYLLRMTGIGSEDFERLHLLLDTLVNDEEETSISSKLHNRRKNDFPGSTSVQVLFPIGTVLGEEPAGSLLCGFALAFVRHAKSSAFRCNACSSS